MFSRENSTKDNCVGLFGTCGVSKWRDPFIEEYTKRNIPFFNPQVGIDQWTPELAHDEARHLANDKIILFPVTNEEYSLGCLCEAGFSILNAIRIDKMRFFVVLIDLLPHESLKKDMTLYQESVKQRMLVTEHIKKLQINNLYFVDNLKDMLSVSLKLFRVVDILSNISQFNL